MDAGGVSMRNIGGGPVMFFSPQAWIDHISEIKAGKYDFPQKEKVPE
jgi:hypothetical protein